MPQSKEIQEQMTNKIVDMYPSGKGYKAISKALGLHRNHGQSHYPQIEKTCNSGEHPQVGPYDFRDAENADGITESSHKNGIYSLPLNVTEFVKVWMN